MKYKIIQKNRKIHEKAKTLPEPSKEKREKQLSDLRAVPNLKEKISSFALRMLKGEI